MNLYPGWLQPDGRDGWVETWWVETWWVLMAVGSVQFSLGFCGHRMFRRRWAAVFSLKIRFVQPQRFWSNQRPVAAVLLLT